MGVVRGRGWSGGGTGWGWEGYGVGGCARALCAASTRIVWATVFYPRVSCEPILQQPISRKVGHGGAGRGGRGRKGRGHAGPPLPFGVDVRIRPPFSGRTGCWCSWGLSRLNESTCGRGPLRYRSQPSGLTGARENHRGRRGGSSHGDPSRNLRGRR